MVVREGFVASAVKFLLACKPSATAESKMAFLTGKGVLSFMFFGCLIGNLGLTIQECFTAFERAKQRAPGPTRYCKDVTKRSVAKQNCRLCQPQQRPRQWSPLFPLSVLNKLKALLTCCFPMAMCVSLYRSINLRTIIALVSLTLEQLRFVSFTS